MRTALFPGSFDPVTNGHLDVIRRALLLFDKVIVAVAISEAKTAMFSIPERKQILENVCRNIHNLEIISFEGLLIDAVKKYKPAAVVRGLRAISDFEYEFQMAMMNRELNQKYETVFLMSSPSNSFISSRMIKEIVKLKGNITPFVPKEVLSAMKQKYKKG